MTAAGWISDGSELPEGTVALQVSPMPHREWQVGRFTFRRARRVGHWSCETGGCGAAAYRTPLGAFLGALRMIREG